MELNQYLRNKQISTDTKNHMQRVFFKRMNEIILGLGNSLAKHGELNEDVVIKQIRVRYVLSRTAIQNYMQYLKDAGIFEYNPTTKTFKLPDHVIVQEEKTQ